MDSTGEIGRQGCGIELKPLATMFFLFIAPTSNSFWGPDQATIGTLFAEGAHASFLLRIICMDAIRVFHSRSTGFTFGQAEIRLQFNES